MYEIQELTVHLLPTYIKACAGHCSIGLASVCKRDDSDESVVWVNTHCPDCRSFSLTTAQFVSDSSSVGHRAACIVCRNIMKRERVRRQEAEESFALYENETSDH